MDGGRLELRTGRGAEPPSAAALWGIRRESERAIHVTIPPRHDHRQADVVAHRRSTLAASDVCRHRGVPVTTPVRTLIDIATQVPSGDLVAAINEADKFALVDPDRLRSALDTRTGLQGVGVLRRVLTGLPSSSPTPISSAAFSRSRGARGFRCQGPGVG
jgi:AbiEi antitoxin C-terminal domain